MRAGAYAISRLPDEVVVSNFKGVIVLRIRSPSYGWSCRIRTTIADRDGGRWALQWGDEIFISNEGRYNENLHQLADSLQTLLDFETADCVALDDSEEGALRK